MGPGTSCARVCQHVNVPRGTMMVVNWESDCRVVAASKPIAPDAHAILGFELCDHVTPHVGQDVRCDQAIPSSFEIAWSTLYLCVDACGWVRYCV